MSATRARAKIGNAATFAASRATRWRWLGCEPSARQTADRGMRGDATAARCGSAVRTGAFTRPRRHYPLPGTRDRSTMATLAQRMDAVEEKTDGLVGQPSATSNAVTLRVVLLNSTPIQVNGCAAAAVPGGDCSSTSSSNRYTCPSVRTAWTRWRRSCSFGRSGREIGWERQAAHGRNREAGAGHLSAAGAARKATRRLAPVWRGRCWRRAASRRRGVARIPRHAGLRRAARPRHRGSRTDHVRLRRDSNDHPCLLCVLQVPSDGARYRSCARSGHSGPRRP